ncbi:MAG: DUF2239 family protein [Candidatus Obscuribacterales bacterium]|nr:DUF2239 family protein [Candidatus Obscuribacterales bacterium]
MEKVSCAVFVENKLLREGDIVDVALYLKRLSDLPPYLVFDAASGKQVDLDLSGSESDIISRIQADFPSATAEEGAERKGPGRPKLGVVAREVTLLPRHWDWLNEQPG